MKQNKLVVSAVRSTVSIVIIESLEVVGKRESGKHVTGGKVTSKQTQ